MPYYTYIHTSNDNKHLLNPKRYIMPKIAYALIACITLFIGCSLPDTKKPIAMMENYWRLYKAKQYDSLKTFYLPKDQSPEARFAKLFEALNSLTDELGPISRTNLNHINSEISGSTGSTVALTYQVIYERGTVEHEFKFKETEKGVFKIQDHSFSR